jgi:hypothetical protein
MRRWAPKLVLLAVSLLLAAGLVEIGFRITADEPWYERLEQEQNPFVVPRQAVAGEAFKIRAGLDETPKRPEAYRILFLGDSFTYGSGVEDAGRVFPALVTTKLNENRDGATAREFEFFNGGIPGSLTPKWVKLLDAAVGPYRPDLVVTVFFLRNGTRGVGGSRRNIRAVGEQMARLSEESWLFRRSCTYRFFRERRAQTEFSREYLEAMRTAYLGGPDSTAEWRRARENLLKLRETSENHGARFALVIFPVLFALGPDYPLADVCDEIERFAGEQGIPVLSLLPAFTGERAPSLWVSPLDQHPNARAHLLAAESIAGFVAPLTREGGSR